MKFKNINIGPAMNALAHAAQYPGNKEWREAVTSNLEEMKSVISAIDQELIKLRDKNVEWIEKNVGNKPPRGIKKIIAKRKYKKAQESIRKSRAFMAKDTDINIKVIQDQHVPNIPPNIYAGIKFMLTSSNVIT